MKYQVEWKHHQIGVRHKHGVFDTFDEAMDSIYAWWEQNDYKPRHVRYWTKKDGLTTIDYGFHHMFYYISEIPEGGESMILSYEKKPFDIYKKEDWLIPNDTTGVGTLAVAQNINIIQHNHVTLANQINKLSTDEFQKLTKFIDELVVKK